ncbi:MAG: type II toxin-antitoxin system ParD family antitoxin [Candidatus Tectomicrobia bacterium]|nr:type II toxin-antitoxin system ParD family antitoxin [Candidatus Tectomicrobia bacterium]
MIRKTISMPDEMSAWIEDRIRGGHYNNDSEYFRDLVRRDQERQEAITQLRQMLDDAEASGISDRTVGQIWEAAKTRYLKRRSHVPADE